MSPNGVLEVTRATGETSDFIRSTDAVLKLLDKHENSLKVGALDPDKGRFGIGILRLLRAWVERRDRA